MTQSARPMDVERLEQALSRYDKIDEIIPGFQWSDDTALVIDAAKAYLSLMRTTESACESKTSQERAEAWEHIKLEIFGDMDAFTPYGQKLYDTIYNALMMPSALQQQENE
jgi:hypothetical protein